jgi:hypothetical protein
MLTSPSKYKHYFWIANSRYDDFVALHANATGGGINLNGFKGREAFKDKTMEDELERFMDNGIHKTGTFLPCELSAASATLRFDILNKFVLAIGHRNALQLWEDALNSECGYEGTQPCKSLVIVFSIVTDSFAFRLGLVSRYTWRWRLILKLTGL